MQQNWQNRQLECVLILINSSCNTRTTSCLLEAFFCLKCNSVHQSDHKNKTPADCLRKRIISTSALIKSVNCQLEKGRTEHLSVHALTKRQTNTPPADMVQYYRTTPTSYPKSGFLTFGVDFKRFFSFKLQLSIGWMKRSKDWNPSQTLTVDSIKSSGIILSSPMVTIKCCIFHNWLHLLIIRPLIVQHHCFYGDKLNLCSDRSLSAGFMSSIIAFLGDTFCLTPALLPDILVE